MKNFYYCKFVFAFFCIKLSIYLVCCINMDIVLVINYMLCLILQEDGLFKPRESAYHKTAQCVSINCKCVYFVSYILLNIKRRVNWKPKSAKKFEPQLNCLVSFNSDTHGLKSGRQVSVRYYREKWSHYVPFVFNKLRDKIYLRFSFDSP